MKRHVLDVLLEARERGRTPVLATDLASGGQAILFPLEEGRAPLEEGLTVDEDLLEAARAAAERAESGVVEGADGPLFLRPYAPPVRLVVVGAVHVAQALAAMARVAGLGVVVVDPRRAFATEERFPDTRLVHAWPEEALAGLALDHRTAVVTLTHDPKLDDPALVAALASSAFYVGALGSRRTHERRLERLRSAGTSADALDRIHGPVGLDIGARTPGEIAVSVLAQVVAELHGSA